MVEMAEECNENLCVFIVCPYIHLVSQWEEDVVRWTSVPIIIAHSKSPDSQWRNSLLKAYKRFRKDKSPFVCITTNDTYASEEIQQYITRFSEEQKVLLVVDEAHNFGSLRMSQVMPENIKYRIALSATIKRHMDKSGTKRISDSGTFTSSFVTLLISVFEYRTERRVAIENYCEANYRLLKKLYSIDFLNIEIPLELLQEYYKDRSESAIFDTRVGYIYDETFSLPDFASKTKIKEHIWNETGERLKAIYNNPERKQKYLEDMFNSKIQEYDESIERIMGQYVELGENLSRRDISEAYCKIDFILGNRTYRNKLLYEEIYKRQAEMIALVKKLQWHFTGEGRSNINAMISFICEAQAFFFSEKDTEHYKSVYMQYIFEMECNIFNVLKKLYGKKYTDEKPKREIFRKVCYIKKISSSGISEN